MTLDELLARAHEDRRAKDPCWGCLFHPGCPKRLSNKLCETIKRKEKD